jgi:hypothetical protein
MRGINDMGDTTTAITRFKLDRYSPIDDDLRLLKINPIDYQPIKKELFETRTIGLFQHEQELYLYLFIPQPNAHLVEITINQKFYPSQLIEKKGLIHKYLINTSTKPGLYKITQYRLVDEKLKRITLTVREEHVFGVLNHLYYYDSKRYYQTFVAGELFHEIVDLTTIKDQFEDFLGRSLSLKDVSTLKSKKAKLYFVCFNLYDDKLSKYFVPQDIVEMKVHYDEDRYVFLKNKHPITIAHLDLPFNPDTAGQHFVNQRHQKIAKDKVLMTHGEKSDWNLLANFFTYKEYQYSTIYKINANPNMKLKGTEKYSYALTLGPKNGYRESKETITQLTLTEKFLSFDYDVTTLKNISVFEVTYQEKGQKYSLPVNSLVYETDKKASLPRPDHGFMKFLKLSYHVIATPIKFLFKLPVWIYRSVVWIFKNWKWLLTLIAIACLSAFAMWIYLTFIQ